jgi:hypothetical protein
MLSMPFVCISAFSSGQFFDSLKLNGTEPQDTESPIKSFARPSNKSQSQSYQAFPTTIYAIHLYSLFIRLEKEHPV